jgi:hypothetical protein
MLRYIACLIGLLAIITAPSVYGQESTRSVPSAPAPVSAPLPAEAAGSGTGLVTVLLLCFVTALLLGVIVWQWYKTPQAKDDDKALEGLRIIYGFWLIVVALLIALLVLFVTLTTIRTSPDNIKTTDIVAIIGTVTGLITTLVAAFFGIQQAGAGRSQAMTALAQLRGPGPDGAGVSTLEPVHGPHSGGTRVSITGNGFTGAHGVNFGATQGTDFKLENDGLVTVNSPAAPPKVDEAKVSIIFPGTSPPNREVGTFYYYTIVPTHGGAAGKDRVKILGSGLKDISAVKFGAKDATELSDLKPPSTDSFGREFREVTAPDGTAGSDVTVELVYPVESNLKTSVIGTYHYD